MGDNLFVKFDEQIASIAAAKDYAEKHFDELVEKMNSCAKTVYTTYCYELGIACPSLVNHRVIGNHKRGRVIRRIKENDSHCTIGYDENNKPVYFAWPDRSDIYLFFEYDGYHWAVQLYTDPESKYYRRCSHGDVYKYCYDSKGRILYYASIVDDHSIMANYYEYPQNEEEPVICRFYDYLPHLNKSSKDIPAGYEHSPMSEYRYELSPDFKIIKEYHKSGDEFVFSREICSKGEKSAKPKIAEDSFEHLSEWLDRELVKDIPEEGGVYFDIFGATEDGFGLYLCITEDFTTDDDDWACDVKYSSDMCMISTNGEMKWEDVLKNVVRLLKKYMRSGEKRLLLKKYKGVGTAYSDSDVEYIYVKK